MRLASGFTLAVATLLVAACGGEDPVSVADPCTDDTGSVDVAVTGDPAAPVFAWNPSCAVAFLIVEQSAGDKWFIGTDEAAWSDPAQANLFTPPVTYGVAPAGTDDEYGPDPLASGVTYDVTLWRVPPGSTANCLAEAFGLCMLANHAFVP